MTNTIVHVAIHDLVKQDAGGFAVILRNGNLNVTAATQRVIDSLYQLYSRRSSKSHGKFSTSADAAPTQAHIETYRNTSYLDFEALTSSLMVTLAHQAGLRQASLGGHVFFAHFVREAQDYLLVVIVNDKMSAALTGSYDVNEVEHLDIDGFRFAGRINLAGWARREERYIGFLKGAGPVSEYFKSFLGCDTVIQERQDTMDLVNTLKAFADDQGLAGVEREAFLSQAKEICDRSARAKRELSFTAFANELRPEAPEVLLNVLTDPERALNEGFVPHRGALNSLTKFKGRTKAWSVEFEREALHTRKVRYNPDEQTITLYDLPAELIEQLSQEEK